MIATHKIEELTFDNNYIFLKVDGKTLMIPLKKASKKLLEADDIQKGIYKISASGYGIHWPLIDEDLSVDNLIKIAE
jgi:hypothetical protein